MLRPRGGTSRRRQRLLLRTTGHARLAPSPDRPEGNSGKASPNSADGPFVRTAAWARQVFGHSPSQRGQVSPTCPTTRKAAETRAVEGLTYDRLCSLSPQPNRFARPHHTEEGSSQGLRPCNPVGSAVRTRTTPAKKREQSSRSRADSGLRAQSQRRAIAGNYRARRS